jgi:hypothetical protein
MTMDKKKVKELIQEAKHLAILRKYENRQTYLNNCICRLEEALKELNKPDWVSVEDELPPYDKVVWVTSKMSPDTIFKNRRVECTTVPKDGNDFIILWEGRMARITHWKPIDKLEE